MSGSAEAEHTAAVEIESQSGVKAEQSGTKRPLESEDTAGEGETSVAVVGEKFGQEEPPVKRLKVEPEGAKDEEAAKVATGDDTGGEEERQAPSADTTTDSSTVPKPDLETAKAAAAKATGETIDIGTRIEVRWEVVDEENEDEDNSIGVWWGSKVAELVNGHQEYSGVFRLEYDRKEVDGKSFDAEEREVAFCGRNMLVDIESEKDAVGGGNKGFMHWRLEGTSVEPPPLLAVSDRVKAKYRGGEEWLLAVISELHPDGTYDVLYDDGDEETHVSRDLVEPAPEEDLDESDDTVADSIDSFFELFVEKLMGGDMYKRLPPEKQRMAAEKVNALRPLVRQELERIKDERGPGTTVTGEDMAQIIPRVMALAREQQGAQQGA